jgi:DNA-binding CsgD family transcriptional regulator
MLTNISPTRTLIDRAEFLPQLLAPLAHGSGVSLDLAVLDIIRRLGFDSFMYGTSTSPRPTHESKSYVFTTLPRQWVARYDERAYIEVDPRVLHGAASSAPLIWDRESESGRNTETDAFLTDAAVHGVASGVAFGLHDSRASLVIVALNSVVPRIDEQRRFTITSNLGDILLLGIYFHELFMKNVVAGGAAPRSQGAPLSNREKQCLQLAAQGRTSHDIAQSLAISERTIQFHFDGIRSKLNAANRQQAVAKAIAEGLIHP